jgi:cell filamentation protein
VQLKCRAAPSSDCGQARQKSLILLYKAIQDPYCYKGGEVLRNRLGLRDRSALDAFEADATAQRFDEPLPSGRFGVAHYRAVHRHLFGDVYAWAGRFRTVRIAKGDSMFCYPEHIDREMSRVFADLKAKNLLRGMPAPEFADECACFLSQLNAIHPFRDGNGRAQLAFVSLLAHAAGFRLNLERMEPEPFLAAMIESFFGRTAPLRRALLDLIVPID